MTTKSQIDVVAYVIAKQFGSKKYVNKPPRGGDRQPWSGELSDEPENPGIYAGVAGDALEALEQAGYKIVTTRKRPRKWREEAVQAVVEINDAIDEQRPDLATKPGKDSTT